MKKSKVLFILHLPPPMHGAAMMGSYLKQSAVINKEFEADFINLATNKVLSESGKGSFKKIITFARLLKQVTTTLRHKKYDLCYITLTAYGAGFYKDFLVVSIVKIWNKNIIFHFHNKGVSGPKNKFTDVLYRYIFKNTKTILLSRYLYPDIRQYVSEKDVFYCPNGIPANQNAAEVEESNYNKKETCCELLFLSNIMREKGVFDLLDACDLMKQKGIRFKCHFVGGWLNVTEEEFNKKIRDKGLSEVVIAHGPKYGADKETFYKKAQIFVFPTCYDTFPLVCLEAMQNGLAIISTPEGGICDIIIDGETGFLVPQHNPIALAEKLTVLIENPALRANMQNAGKDRFQKHFTLGKWEKNMVTVLQEAICSN